MNRDSRCAPGSSDSPPPAQVAVLHGDRAKILVPIGKERHFMCRTIRVDCINDGIPHDHCDSRIPARRITDSLRDRRIILFLQDVAIRDLHRVDNALVHDAERNRVENLRIDRVDRHIARDRAVRFCQLPSYPTL